METRSVYIETYGCQMNIADTELILGLLKPHGYESTPTPDGADVILLNTCAIRERAEERIIGRLGDFVKYKARKPGVVLGLTGCMAQHHREALLDKAPFLDLVLGPDAYRNLPALLAQERADEPLVSVRLDRDETYADIAPARGEGVRAWVTIMRGCDKFCTFCIVPYVRGRERSVPAPALLDQVRALAEQGYKEVVYLGQTVNAYRDGEVDFGRLLHQTARIDGIERIRFTSPHPSDMDASAIDALASCDKVAPYLHLPLQAASNRVLERMERGYSIEEYAALMERLRAAIPHLALSTDIIVGFRAKRKTTSARPTTSWRRRATILPSCSSIRRARGHAPISGPRRSRKRKRGSVYKRLSACRKALGQRSIENGWASPSRFWSKGRPRNKKTGWRERTRSSKR